MRIDRCTIKMEFHLREQNSFHHSFSQLKLKDRQSNLMIFLVVWNDGGSEPPIIHVNTRKEFDILCMKLTEEEKYAVDKS